MELWLDVNTDIYPMDAEHQKFSFALASTLNLDGSPDEGVYDASERSTLADKFEYVMYGKVFKYQEETSPSVKVYHYNCACISLLPTFGSAHCACICTM